MRAAVVTQIGSVPKVGNLPPPQCGGGSAYIAVVAAALNPVDLTIGRGVHPHLTTPPVPYVPGREGVGTVLDGPEVLVGKRVYAPLRSAGGMLAEEALAHPDDLVEVPEGVDATAAAALGVAGTTAWLALCARAGMTEGETVLVMGASGAVGALAVQIAVQLGAGRVVAAARNAEGLQRARARGADAVVDLAAVDDLPDRLREACGGGADVIVDPLWGAPAAAALEAARPGGRLVALGTSAGRDATIGATVRGRSHELLGHPVPWARRHEEPALRRDAYRRLIGWLAEGRIVVDVERLPLAAIGEAWRRQGASPGRKLVIDL